MNFSRTNPIAVRHTQSGHGVQCRTADVGLGDLRVKAASPEPILEQGLEPENRRLGQAAPMVATLLFSRRQTDFSDPLQKTGARMHRAIGVGGPGLSVLAWGNHLWFPKTRSV